LENDSVNGVINSCAPEMITNAEFTKALARTLNRPAILTVPEWVLKIALGERSSLLLEGKKIYPKRTLETGFKFKFPTIDGALKDILGTG